MALSSVDEALSRAGGFGNYQRRVLAIGSLVHGAAAMQSVAFLLTGRKPQATCDPPVGGCIDGNRQGCSWQPSYTLDSYVAEFGLVCSKEYLDSLLTTGYFAGYALGAFLAGRLCDSHGRRPVSLVALLLTCMAQMISGLVPNYELLFAARFALGVAFGGVSNATYTWFVEFVCPADRSMVVSVLFTTYACCCCLNSALAYSVAVFCKHHRHLGLHSWRLLSIVLPVPTLLVLPLCLYISESPRFLREQKNLGRFQAVMRKIAECNGRSVEEMHLHDLAAPRAGKNDPSSSHIDRGTGSHTDSHTDSSKASACALLSSVRVHGTPVKVLVAGGSYLWFVIVTTWYGSSIYLSRLPGSIYINVLISNLIQVPAYVASSPIAVVVGQSRGLRVSLLACGLFSLVFAAATDTSASATSAGTNSSTNSSGLVHGRSHGVWLETLAFASYFFVTLAFTFIYTYSSELFPTEVRARAMGIMNIFGRIGGMVSPQIAGLTSTWPPLVPIIFGVVGISGAVFVSFLPDTQGLPTLEKLSQQDSAKAEAEAEAGHAEAREEESGPLVSMALDRPLLAVIDRAGQAALY